MKVLINNKKKDIHGNLFTVDSLEAMYKLNTQMLYCDNDPVSSTLTIHFSDSSEIDSVIHALEDFRDGIKTHIVGQFERVPE